MSTALSPTPENSVNTRSVCLALTSASVSPLISLIQSGCERSVLHPQMAETRFGVYSVRGEELGQRPHPIPLLLRTAWRRGRRRRGRGAQRGPHPRAGRHSWEAGALTWTPGLRARRGGRQPGGFLNPLPWPGPHFPSTAPPREGERALAGQPSSSAQEAREPRHSER